MLTEEQAIARGSTKQHIILNRIADRVAKQLAHRLSPVEHAVHLQAKHEIYKHHHWLSVLHALLPTKNEAPADEQAEGVSELPEKLYASSSLVPAVALVYTGITVPVEAQNTIRSCTSEIMATWPQNMDSCYWFFGRLEVEVLW